MVIVYSACLFSTTILGTVKFDNTTIIDVSSHLCGIMEISLHPQAMQTRPTPVYEVFVYCVAMCVCPRGFT